MKVIIFLFVFFIYFLSSISIFIISAYDKSFSEKKQIILHENYLKPLDKS